MSTVTKHKRRKSSSSSSSGKTKRSYNKKSSSSSSSSSASDSSSSALDKPKRSYKRKKPSSSSSSKHSSHVKKKKKKSSKKKRLKVKLESPTSSSSPVKKPRIKSSKSSSRSISSLKQQRIDHELRNAAMKGKAKKCKLLLEQGANPFAVDADNDNILEVALVEAHSDKHVEVVRILLSSYPELAACSSGYSALVRGVSIRYVMCCPSLDSPCTPIHLPATLNPAVYILYNTYHLSSLSPHPITVSSLIAFHLVSKAIRSGLVTPFYQTTRATREGYSLCPDIYGRTLYMCFYLHIV